MKKLLLLFAVMLSTVGAWAQNVVTSTDANPKYYVIASYNRGGYLTNAGVGNGITHVALSDAGYWYFEKANDNGGVYIVNKVKDGESKVYVGSDKKASTTSAVWYVLENGVNKKGFSISSTNPISSESCIDANNYNEGVGSWNPSADDWNGTTWVVCSTEDNTYNPENLIFRTRSDRYVTSISLESSMSAATPGNSTTINRDFTGDNGLAYIDLTGSVTMKAVAGETVTASIARNGNWTNAYVYIDKDADGFTASYDTEAKTLGGDLMTFSFYSGDEASDATGVNSAGNELTGQARNTLTMPSFQAPSTPGTYRMRFKHDWNSINPNGGNANFNSNGGSIIDVTLEVVSSTIEVNYSFTWKGVEKFTQTATTIVGDEYPAITTTFPFGVSATKPEGTITELDVVDGKVNKTIELESNLPFVYAADNTSIEHWYYLSIKGNKLIDYVEGQEAIDLNMTSVPSTVDGRDACTWAFVGNPFDGYKLYNKKAGLTKILSSSTTIGGNGATTYPILIEETAVPDGNNTLWFATASTHQTNGFFLAQKGYDSNRMNDRDNKLAYWTGGADNGSTFTISERDFTGITELQALVNKVKAQQSNYVGGTEVGLYSQASVDAVSVAIDAADAALAGEMTEAISLEHQTAINTAVAGLAFNAPVKGKFYRLKNAASGNYMSGNADNITLLEPNAGSSANSTVFYLTEENEILSFNSGLYLDCKEKAYCVIGTPHWGSFNAAYGGAKANVVTYKNNGYWTYGAGADGAGLDKGESAPNHAGYNWTLEEVEWLPVPMNVDAGYATLYSPVALSTYNWKKNGHRVEAYTGVIDGEKLSLTRIDAEDGIIPANTPVVLKYVADAENGNVFLQVSDSEKAAIESDLKGTLADTYVTDNSYVLSRVNDVVGFYKATKNQQGNTAFLNNGFKAYLPAATGAESRFLVFNFGDDNATAIEGIEAENTADAVVYDLAGRRVQKAQKGLYIVNGKKVIK